VVGSFSDEIWSASLLFLGGILGGAKEMSISGVPEIREQ
jgi:hypothetical protein